MGAITHEHHAQVLKLTLKARTDKVKEPEVRRIYQTCGVYMGYGLAQHGEFFMIDHVMV